MKQYCKYTLTFILLNIVFLRFIQIIAYSCNSCTFIAALYYLKVTQYIYPFLLLMDNKACFQFLLLPSVTNNNCAKLSWCTYASFQWGNNVMCVCVTCQNYMLYITILCQTIFFFLILF